MRPKKSEFCWPSSFFLLSLSHFSRFFIYFYCVTRLKCALQIFMPANCLKREQNMFICHTHTPVHTPAHTCKFPAHLFAFFFLSFLCILFRTRIKVCCSRIIHATKELALCHASPRLRLCVAYVCVCVCALNIPTLSEFICPDNAILVQLRLVSCPLLFATPPFAFYLYSFVFSIEIEIVTVTVHVGERDGTSVD